MPPKWSWTEQKRKAARLLAEGCHKQTEIATKLGIARETLRLWKEHEEFKTEIDNQIQLLEQDRKHEREQQEKTKADCQSLLDRVTSVVEQITSEQLEAINKNPIAAINLWLRLHNAVNTTQKRNTANNTLPQTLPNLSPKLLNESWQFLREKTREEMHPMANPPPSFYQFLQRTISFKPHPRADHLANLASQISEISQIPPIYAQPCQVHGSRFTVDRSPFTIHYSLFTIHRSP